MTLFQGVPVTPGLGGYTYPIPNPVIWQVPPRVNVQLCTPAEAQEFIGFLLRQGDIVAPGQVVYVRQQTDAELKVDVAFLLAGYLPLVAEFAGRVPSKGAADVPPAQSSVRLTPDAPYYYSINIGTMLATAPGIVPGGPQGLNKNYRLQVKGSGSLIWVGLDQPSWEVPVSQLTA